LVVVGVLGDVDFPQSYPKGSSNLSGIKCTLQWEGPPRYIVAEKTLKNPDRYKDIFKAAVLWS